MDAAETLKELAHGFANAAIGESFFKSLAEYLAKALAVDYAFIGELQNQSIHSIAFYVKGKLVDPMYYPVVGSLCEYVVASPPKFCAFTESVQQQFPHNQALKEFGADSYIGTPLLDAHGKVLGLIYIMHSKPIDNLEQVEALLNIVAKRAALELERVQQDKQLQAKNQTLAQINEELIRTQEALRQANAKLEQRVEQRTQALSSREEELHSSLKQLKETNQILIERESFLSSIVNQTSVGIAQTDLTGRFTFANDGYCKMVGLPLSELLTKTLTEITHPQDMQDNFALLERLIQTGQGFEMETRYLRPDGSMIWCLITVSRVEQVEELPPRIMGICQDITARKRAEEALRHTEKRFQLVSKATNDTVWDWDLRINKVWRNEGFQMMFGYRGKEIDSGIESWHALIHPEDRKRVTESLYHVIDIKSQQWSAEYRFRRADGTYAYVLDRAYALQDEEGRTYRMLGSMLDLTERKQADEAIKQLSTEFQFLTDAIPTLVWRGLPDGRVEYYNRRWYEYTGLTEAQSMNHGWTLPLHPEDYTRTMQEIHLALQTGGAYHIEYRIKGSDGTYRWFLVQALPLKDEQGNIIKWFGTCTDIHDQKETEEALRLSQQQEREANAEVERQRHFLHLLFSQLPAVLCVLKGPELIFELANETYRKVTGEREYIGKPIQEVLPEISPDMLEIYQQVYQTGERFIGESFPIRLDWDTNGVVYIKYFDFVHEPFRNEQGRVDGVITFGYEVSNQVLARQVLEQSEARVRLILESIPHLAWTSPPASPINYFNKRWYEFTGLSEEQSLGLGWRQVLHPDDLPLAVERSTIGRSKGEPFTVENRYRKASDGSYRWHLSRMVPIRDEYGYITLWVGTATDIHDQKEAQYKLENTLKELNEKNFELDQFVYKTSHDLRAPLTTIMGLISILKQEQSETTKAHYVDLMENRVHRLDTFIKSMLDYSRNTRTATRLEKIKVEALLQECIAELEYMRHFERLHFRLEVEETELYSDVFRLKVILSNIISNAIKYQDLNKELSKLEIRVKPNQAQKQIIIQITDNGLGIGQEYQDRIFSMFFRASEQSDGSGLGLYIVKQAVAVLNGKIELTSTAGVGTQFTITLPTEGLPVE